MLDGRHAGTGGGNHVVMGGADAGRQPVPAPARSAQACSASGTTIPALSYLFTGLFIGPTSQHPRIDEARQDSLYELEIAFTRRSRSAASSVPPGWSTGCSASAGRHDRQHAPDRVLHRQALLARHRRPAGSAWWSCARFEMPPHARMCLAQQLLMRALVAAFWRQPYERRLVRWGTRAARPISCCRTTSREDFRDVLDELRQRGYRFDAAWFAPHFEFRFPPSARSRCAASRWSCARRWSRGTCWARSRRAAAPRATSTARWSACRCGSRLDGRTLRAGLQRPRGAAARRPARAGEFIAGVRFKAWQPPVSALHPTIYRRRRRWCSISTTAGPAAAWAADAPRRRIPAAATTTLPGQRQRSGGAPAAPASSRSATRRGQCAEPPGTVEREHPRTLESAPTCVVTCRRRLPASARRRDGRRQGWPAPAMARLAACRCSGLGHDRLAERAQPDSIACWRRKASPACCLARRPIRGGSIRSPCRCRNAEFSRTRGRTGAARAAARCGAGRHLRAAVAAGGWRAAAGTVFRQSRLPAAVPRRSPRTGPPNCCNSTPPT